MLCMPVTSSLVYALHKERGVQAACKNAPAARLCYASEVPRYLEYPRAKVRDHCVAGPPQPIALSFALLRQLGGVNGVEELGGVAEDLEHFPTLGLEDLDVNQPPFHAREAGCSWLCSVFVISMCCVPCSFFRSLEPGFTPIVCG